MLKLAVHWFCTLKAEMKLKLDIQLDVYYRLKSSMKMTIEKMHFRVKRKAMTGYCI